MRWVEALGSASVLIFQPTKSESVRNRTERFCTYLMRLDSQSFHQETCRCRQQLVLVPLVLVQRLSVPLG
jgi:hypothetical protein